MKSIVIIGCYFGKLRNDFPLWLLSCKKNETIDWIIFTDQQCSKFPNNVKFVDCKLENLKSLFENKLKMKIILEKPYKLCDYRPAYGFLFQEYIKQYDFWGYCDFDMIFGDLRKFFTEELLNDNDKLLCFGHLSIYKNTIENNLRFTKKGENLYYKQVFTDNKSYIFDEIVGIYSFYKNNNWNIYITDKIIDISSGCNRFIRANEMDKFVGIHTKNYKQQTFLWDNGRVYFEYVINGKVKYEECIYIHMSKRNFTVEKNFVKSKNLRILVTKYGIIDIGNTEIDLGIINKYNPPCNVVFEKFQCKINMTKEKIIRHVNKSYSHKKPKLISNKI